MVLLEYSPVSKKIGYNNEAMAMSVRSFEPN